MPRPCITIVARAGKAHATFLRRLVPKAWRLVRTHLRELSLVLVGDREMAGLHERFMGLAGPTDVLTFPVDTDARGRPTSGEVVICVPEARRRARARRVPLPQELLLYALHGMLHLSSFDDQTDADFRRMHRKEDQVLTALGFGAVFARGESGAAAPAGVSRPSERARGAKP